MAPVWLLISSALAHVNLVLPLSMLWTFSGEQSSHSATLSTVSGAGTFTTLWACGYNNCGQLGDGTLTLRTPPVQVGTRDDWRSVTGGFYHTVAVQADGSLWSWGLNNYGQLGDGGTENEPIPAKIGTDPIWSLVAVAGSHVAALKPDGTLWGWGANSSGQLGVGAQNTPGEYLFTDTTAPSAPVRFYHLRSP